MGHDEHGPAYPEPDIRTVGGMPYEHYEPTPNVSRPMRMIAWAGTVALFVYLLWPVPAARGAEMCWYGNASWCFDATHPPTKFASPQEKRDYRKHFPQAAKRWRV